VRQRPGLTPEQRVMALRLRARGFEYKEIVEQIDVPKSSAHNAAIGLTIRTAKPPALLPGPGRLVLKGREEISLGLDRGASFGSIAGGLGRSLSTASREVAANGGRCDYRAWRAHQRAAQRSLRPKTQKLATPGLATQVVARGLKKWWSPQEISMRLRLEFPDDPMMWVSHETIYRFHFVQGRGELRRELTRCLRSGRTQRRAHEGRRLVSVDDVLQRHGTSSQTGPTSPPEAISDQQSSGGP